MKLFRHRGKRYSGLGAAFTTYRQGGITYIKAAFVLFKPCRNFAQVSRKNRIPEFHGFQCTIHNKIILEFLQHEMEAALGHDFAQNNTGYYGIPGKVTLAVERIFRDAVCCMTNASLIRAGAVKKEHRSAVREILLDFFTVHFSSSCGFPQHTRRRVRGMPSGPTLSCSRASCHDRRRCRRTCRHGNLCGRCLQLCSHNRSC